MSLLECYRAVKEYQVSLPIKRLFFTKINKSQNRKRINNKNTFFIFLKIFLKLFVFKQTIISFDDLDPAPLINSIEINRNRH